MKPKDEQIIKSTLNTLIEITYNNMIQINEKNGTTKDQLELLIGYKNDLLKMIEENLFT